MQNHQHRALDRNLRLKKHGCCPDSQLICNLPMEKIMKNSLLALTMAALLGLGGCAGLQKPTTAALDAVPVVQFGQAVPANGDFILHFPAGKPIPVVATVKGSAFSRDAESTLNVTLKSDIYAYRQWVSFDRKTWRHSDDVLDFNVDIKIPSPLYPKPGLITLQVDLK